MDKFISAVSTNGRLVPIRQWVQDLERKQGVDPALEGIGQRLGQALAGWEEALIDNLLVKVSASGEVEALNGWRFKALPFSCRAFLANFSTSQEAVEALTKRVAQMDLIMSRQCRGMDLR